MLNSAPAACESSGATKRKLMNSKFFRQCIGAAVGLTLLGGCARPSAQTPPQPIVSAVPSTTVVAQTAPGASVREPAPNEETPHIEQRVPPAQPANVSPGVQEIVKLAQAGVGEETMLTYIERYPSAYNVTADQIVYLNDLGVSTTVVNAMMKHDGNSVAANSAAPQNAPQPNYSSAPPALNDVPVATAPATPTEEVTYFYDSLAPYGSWIYVSGYGWCWQPTVAVTTATWAPYCDRGRWYWSDSGWYWQSDYTWGWAAFHYGRWYRHPGCGWVWMPGTTWGPAWVSWRYSDAYCGWAPLPPHAVFLPGGGFTYYGRHVAVGFDFGLSFHHYTFISVGRFCDPHPYHHVVPRTTVVNVYKNTTIINNYNYRNGTVVNHGMGRDTIARRSQTEVRNVKVQNASFATANDRMSKVERKGNDLVVYRPQLPKEPPVKPSVVQNRMAQQARQVREANQPRGGRDNTPAAASNNNRDERERRAERREASAPGNNRAANNNTTPVAPAAPRGPRNERNERNERAANETVTPRAAAPSAPSTTPVPAPRVDRPAARQEPGNVARQNEPQAPATTSPRGNESRVERRAESPRAQAPAPSAPHRVYPESRAQAPAASAPTAPLTPRSSPSMSPRYSEQYGGHAGRVAPSTPNHAAPSYSAPGHGGGNAGPRSAPSAGNVERGGGGGHGRGDGGGRGEGGGRGNR
jgi:hypothetical protein